MCEPCLVVRMGTTVAWLYRKAHHYTSRCHTTLEKMTDDYGGLLIATLQTVVVGPSRSNWASTQSCWHWWSVAESPNRIYWLQASNNLEAYGLHSEVAAPIELVERWHFLLDAQPVGRQPLWTRVTSSCWSFSTTGVFVQSLDRVVIFLDHLTLTYTYEAKEQKRPANVS